MPLKAAPLLGFARPKTPEKVGDGLGMSPKFPLFLPEMGKNARNLSPPAAINPTRKRKIMAINNY